MLSKRALTAVCTCMIILFGLMGVVGLGVPGAWAAGGLTVLSSIEDPYSERANHFYRTDRGTGGVAYCAQGWLRTPLVGQSLERYGSLGIPELDYVMWHGYDGEMVTSLYGMDRTRSEVATGTAVWLAIADQRGDVLDFHKLDGSTYHGNKGYMERWERLTDAQIKDAAWRLYQEALAYKNRGGGGVEKGCATYWSNRNWTSIGGTPSYDFQGLVTVEKSVRATFTKTSADASVTDGNSQYPLAGAVYDIFSAEDDARVGTVTTDENGHAALDLPPNKQFYAVERTAPHGFQTDPKRIPFSTGMADASVSLKDKPGTFSLFIAKKDATGAGTAQAGASLEGAEYRVSSLSTPGWSATGKTDKGGTLHLSGIPYGDIQVVETKAPEGYRLDASVHTYHVDGPDTVGKDPIELIPENDFCELPIAFDLEIAKFTSEGEGASKIENPAAGVSFEIVSGTTNEVVGRITTDDEGFASTQGSWFGEGERVDGISGALPYDRRGYTVREVASTVPDGYGRVDDWHIDVDQIADGAKLHYIVNNSRLTSRLQIVKLDAATGDVVPRAGFSFQVLDDEGKPVAMEVWHPEHKILDTFTTDEAGSVTLPEALPTGDYALHEVSAVAPYLVANKDIPFSIKPDQDDMPPITVVSMEDDAATGSASIHKSCSTDGGRLEGAKYDVVACEDIVSPAGLVQAGAGAVVASVTTGKDGTATASGLPLGAGSARFAFVETEPPRGHVLDATPHEFTLTYKDDTTEVVTAAVEVQDEPTEIRINKMRQGTKDPVAGAEFYLWNVEHELGDTPQRGHANAYIEAGEKCSGMELQPIIEEAQISIEKPEDVTALLRDESGLSIELQNETGVEPGSYTIVYRAADEGDEPQELEIEVKAGSRYSIRIHSGLFGLTCRIESVETIADPITPKRVDDRGVFSSEGLAPGFYRVVVDGEQLGIIEVEQDSRGYWSATDGRIKRIPIILDGKAAPIISTTDQKGMIIQRHLPAGSYRIAESQAPAGFVTDGSVHEFLIDDVGLIDGSPIWELSLQNDVTKVDLSKRDITSEAEVEGAHLEVLDEEGSCIDKWVSTAEPHRIEALAPGSYKLVETMTPRIYDQADEVVFQVVESGEALPVVMYDEPIQVAGEVDKVQEIVRPVAGDTVENGDGENRAEATASDDGSFCYGIDMRNTGSTWVDEFTMEDALLGVRDGLAVLDSLVTPCVIGDRDGVMNVWYKTNIPRAAMDDGNATLQDGFENPWLDDAGVRQHIGDDGRVLDYAGWRLWRQNVDCTRPETLDVHELDLAEDEWVTDIRLEFGRVDKGFTSRASGWDRDDLKHLHDDADPLETEHGEGLSPLILHMRATPRYRDGIALENHASVSLFRNGGGNGLEDRDEDHVEQVPLTKNPDLPQTGSWTPWLYAAAAATCAIAGAAIWLRHK